ncbi:MAG TPA: hypothetical protein VL295_06235, partial [Gemmatimonadales bacterium]|nr:hypothetical protein [Gemmatimonadales bacterium]
MEQFVAPLKALADAGLLIQVTGATVLWLLFHIVRQQGTDRRYFRLWTVAWGFFALAFLALTVRYRLFTGMAFNVHLQSERQPMVLALYAIYQVAKMWGVGFLITGALAFNHIPRPRWPIWISLVAAFAVLTVLFVPTFEGALAWQAFVVAPAYGLGAWAFLRTVRSDRSLGRTLTGAMLAALAVLWVLYG